MTFLSLLKNLKRAALFCILLCLFFSGFSKARIERGVEIRQAKPGFIETIPRNSITLVFQVKNTSQKALSFKGDAQIPDGWQILTQEFPFSLSSGQQAVRLVNIFVPTKTQTGHYHVSYWVKSKEDPSITACHSVEVHVLLHAEIQLLKMDEPKIVIAGQDYVTQYIVSNKSNASSTIRLKLQNWPDYSFSISENQFFLKSGESRHIIVRVKTNGKIRQKAKYHHRIIACASDLLEGSVTADVVSQVEIIPTVYGEKDYYHRFPLELKFIQISDNLYGNRTQLALYGSGTLNESGTKRVELLLQGPGKNHLMTFGRIRQEYRLSYTAPNGEAHFGDRFFSLSKLSNYGHYGRGIEARVRIKKFSFKVYHNENQLSAKNDFQTAFQLSFNVSDHNNIHVNYLRKDIDEKPAHQIFSLSADLAPNKNTRFHFEYAVGQSLSETKKIPSRAFWFESTGRYQWLNYRLDLIRSTATFPGTYRDTSFNSASIWISPLKRISINASFYDQKRNIQQKKNELSSYTQYYQYGLKLSFFKEAQISLERITRERIDLNPMPQFHYQDSTLRASLNSNISNFNLLASYDIGQTLNYLTGQSKQLKEYTASLYYRPFDFISLGGHMRWRDQNKNFTGDKTKYSSMSLNLMIRLGRTSFSALYRTSYYQEFFDEIFNDSQLASQLINNSMTQAQINLTHTFFNHHSIGLHFRKLQSPHIHKKGGNIGVYLEYTIPIGIPVHRKLNRCELFGRIYNRDDYKKGLSGVIVRVNGHTTVTDKSGKYIFHGLKPGDYYLSVDIGSLGTDKLTIQKMPMVINLQNQKKTEKNIVVVHKAGICGQVMLYKRKNENTLASKITGNSKQKQSFTPVSGMSNVLVEIKNESEIRRQATDNEGRFNFSDLRPGKWHLKIYPNNLPKFHYFEKDSYDLELNQGEKETLQIKVLPRTRQIKFLDSGEIKQKKGLGKK